MFGTLASGICFGTHLIWIVGIWICMLWNLPKWKVRISGPFPSLLSRIPLCKLPSCWYMLNCNFCLELKSVNNFTINFGATLCYSIFPFRFVWVMVMLLTELWKTHHSPLTFQIKLVLMFWSKWEQGLDSWIFWSAITTSLGRKILRNLLCLLKVFWCN